ncbi:MAG TPA: PHP domain-containing protein [Gemmatimonadaceae bacterium]|nr:PHP domain-containing protein [Gemmatimonadaceae bacterium]
MTPREIAYALRQIGDLLMLRGASRFQVRAYRQAADAVLDGIPGIGPATRAVVDELERTGTSTLLERLRADTPVGLLDVMRIPGMRLAQLRRLHEELGVDSLDSLEAAALDGRLAALPRIGPKTVERLLAGIATVRRMSGWMLASKAQVEAQRLLRAIIAHPSVQRAAIAGSLRRGADLVRDIDIVTVGADDIAGSLSGPGLALDLYNVRPEGFATALWRATGSGTHVEQATKAGIAIDADFASEEDLYASIGLPFIEPELREGMGEIDAARLGRLPRLVTRADIQGVLHTHSTYSDGKATIAELADGARARGWRYIGISDHSEAAFYAGGLTRDAVRSQHDEIDRLNAAAHDGFRILKGIEADILPDGRIDYPPELLDQFDYVIGSIHSRFSMDRDAMTARLLRALDDPHVTILGHPTGRLLLRREPYPVDLEAVMEKAAARGVALEINADPYRLDLNWHWAHVAKGLGAKLSIGPDAHSVAALDNVEAGIAIARKAWLESSDLLVWPLDRRLQ